MVALVAFALIGAGLFTQLIGAWIGVFRFIERKPFGRTPMVLALGVALYTLGLYVPIWDAPRITELRTGSANSWLLFFVVAAMFFGASIFNGRPKDNPILFPCWAGLGLVMALCGAQAFIHWYIYV